MDIFFFPDSMKSGEGSPLVNDSSAKLSSTGQRTAGERGGLAVVRLMVRQVEAWGKPIPLASFLSVSSPFRMAWARDQVEERHVRTLSYCSRLDVQFSILFFGSCGIILLLCLFRGYKAFKRQKCRNQVRLR